jgi:hypothetical protein
MITNDQLAQQVGAGLEVANQILQNAWNSRQLREVEARELAAALRTAATAADELERRATAVVVDV